jgi:hypothetical protein
MAVLTRSLKALTLFFMLLSFCLKSKAMDAGKIILASVPRENAQPYILHLPTSSSYALWAPELNAEEYWFSLLLPPAKAQLSFRCQAASSTKLKSLAFFKNSQLYPQEPIFLINDSLEKSYTWAEYAPGDTVWVRLQLVQKPQTNAIGRIDFDFSPLPSPPKRKTFSYLLPANDQNFTCDKAICLVRDQSYSNRSRPTCTPCNGVWRPPISVCGNGIWSSMDNPVFYKFEVLPTTPQPVSITLVVSECEGGNSALQLGIWGFPTCPGGGQTRFETCNAGIGSVNVSKTLPIGQYFLVADGSAGSLCDWIFESNVTVSVSSNSPAEAPANQQICQGQTLEFTSTQVLPGSSFLWQGPQGFTSTLNAPTIANAMVQNSGTYSVTISPPAGTLCPETLELTTQVTIKPLPALNIPRNNVVCQGQSLTLQQLPQSQVVYFWKGPNNFSATGNSITLTNLTSAQAGIYTLTGVLNGCTATTTAQVIVNPNPNPPSIGNAVLARCGAGPFSFTATASPATNIAIRLYENSTSSFALQTASSSPYVFTFNHISVSSTFYLESINTATGCSSARAAVAIAVHPEITTVAVANAQRCNSGVLTFSITPPSGVTGNLTVRMYTVATGGSVVSSTAISPYQLRTPNLTTTTTYYFDVLNTQTGCSSANRASALAEIIAPPPPPQLDKTNYEVCGNSSLTLYPNISPPSSAVQLSAYTSLLASQSVWQSNSPPYVFTTPLITTHTTFYLESEVLPAGCKSVSRLPVVINYIDAPPPLSNITVSRCGSGPISFTVAVNSPEVTQVRLYTLASGGTPIGSINGPSWSYSLINLTTNTTYYLESSKQNALCSSPTRSTVTLTVNPIPAIPGEQNIQICAAGTVTFTLSASIPNANQVRLFTSSASVNPIQTFNGPPYVVSLGQISSPTTYFIDSYHTQTGCSSAKSRVTLGIIGLPEDFSIANSSRCGPGNVTFSVQPFQPGNYTVSLYSNVGGAVIAQTSQAPYLLTSPFITTSTDFFIRLLDNPTGCGSDYRLVRATVHPLPSNPTVNAIRSCSAGVFTFSASMGSVAGNQIALYNARNETIPIATSNGAPFRLVTPFVQTQTTFWIEAQITNTGCRSERVPAVVEILDLPAPPAIAGVTICSNQSVTVTPNLDQPNLKKVDYYNASTGGGLIHSSTTPPYSFTISNLTASTSYYLEVIDLATGCTSASRSVLPITVSRLPELPQAIRLSRCGPGLLTYTVPLTQTGELTARLYRQVSGGAPIAEAFLPPYELVTPFLTVSTDFFFEWVDRSTQCSAGRVRFEAEILPQPAPPVASNLSRCGPGPVTFSFNPLQEPNRQLLIFRDELLTQVLTHIALPPWQWSTPTVTTSTTYYAVIQNLQNQCNSPARNVSVTIIPTAQAPQEQTLSRCGSGVLQFSWPSLEAQAILIYDSPFSNTPLQVIERPLVWNTPFLTANAVYYAAALNTTRQCTSAKTELQAIVRRPPLAPSPSTLESCQPATFTLQVTPSVYEATEVRLYSAPSGGEALQTADAPPYQIVLPFTAQNTRFYIEAYNASAQCSSPRTSIDVIIKTKPPAPLSAPVFRCGSGVVTFSLSEAIALGDTLKLYSLPTSSQPIDWAYEEPFTVSTPFLTSSATFYLGVSGKNNCESERYEAIAQIENIPTPPIFENIRRCGQGSATFTLLPSSAEELIYELFPSPMATEPIASAVKTNSVYVLSLENVSSNSTFYVVARNPQTGCKSEPIPALVDILSLPAAPSLAPIFICRPQGVTINYDAPLPSESIINIYANSQERFPIYSSAQKPWSFQTPLLTTSTTYFLSVASPATGCESVRGPIEILLQEPRLPVSWQAPQRCGPGPIAFELEPSDWGGNEVRLYNPELEMISTVAFSPYRFFLPLVTTTANYFVEVYNKATDCLSRRVPLLIEILPLPGPPISRNEKRCGPGSVTFLALPSTPLADEFRLYQNPASTEYFASDNTPAYELVSPPISVTTTFWLESKNAQTGCVSPKVAYVAEIVPPPAPPVASPIVRCQGGPVTFTIVHTGLISGTVRLYTQANSGIPTANLELPENTITLPWVGASQNFYLELEDRQTTCISERSSVEVRIIPPPTPPSAQDSILCGAEQVTFTVYPGSPEGNQMRLYDASQGGALLNSADIAPYRLTFTNLQTHTYLYIESYNTVAGCGSTRKKVIAYKAPGAPIVNKTARCGPGELSLVPGFSRPSGNRFRLYTSTAAAPIDSAVSPPYLLNLPYLSASTVFYLSSFDSATGCESPRKAFEAEIFPVPPKPQVSPITTCTAGKITFSLAYPQESRLLLYGSQPNQPPIFIAEQMPYILETPVISSSTTFLVEAQNSQTGCASEKAALSIEFLPKLQAPLFPAKLSRCGPGSVTFTASARQATAIYFFDSPDNQALPIQRQTVAPFILETPWLGAHATFYLQAVNENNGCKSEKQKIEIFITQNPAPPLVDNASRCGAGTVIFTITPQIPLAERYELLDESENQVAVTQVPNLTLVTPPLITTAFFFVQAVDPQSGCKSDKIRAKAEIQDLPSPPIVEQARRCGPGKVTFTIANPGSKVNVYAAAAQPIAQLTAPPYQFETSIAAITTFYFENWEPRPFCNSVRTPIVGFIDPVPTVPNQAALSLCAMASATLTITLTPESDVTELRLYTLPIGGIPIARDNERPFLLTTPIISDNMTLYIEGYNARTGCSSPRALQPIAVFSPPGAPIVRNWEKCGPGVVNMQFGLSPPFGNRVEIYDSETANLALGFSQTPPFPIASPFVSATRTFYAQVLDTQTGCKSERRPFEIQILPGPAAPSVADVYRCGPGVLTFTASVPFGMEVRFYDAPTAGAPLQFSAATTANFTTPSLTTTTTYYFEFFDRNTQCNSLRRPAQAYIFPLPAPPSLPSASICANAASFLSVTMNNPAGDQARLFSQNAGGNPLSIDGSEPYLLPIPAISQTATFYVEAYNSLMGCASPRVPIRIALPPGNAFAPSVNRCGPGAAVILPRLEEPLASGVNIYDTPTEGRPISSATQPPYALVLPYVAGATTYYLESFDALTGCKSARTPVAVFLAPLPQPPISQDQIRCAPGQFTFVISDAQSGFTYSLFISQEDELPLAQTSDPPFALISPYIATSATFYLEAQDNQTGCKSARAPYRAIIQDKPNPPYTTLSGICARNGIAEWQAYSNLQAADQIAIYDSATGGNMLLIDSIPPYNFRLPVNKPKTIYLEARNSSSGCVSQRTPLLLTPAPAPLSPLHLKRCLGQDFQLELEPPSAGLILALLNSPFQGSIMATALVEPYVFTLSGIRTSTTYFLQTIDPASSCASEATPLVLEVAFPPAPPVIEKRRICENQNWRLFPTGALPGLRFLVYDSFNLNVPLRQTDVFPYNLEFPARNLPFKGYAQFEDMQTGCFSALAPIQIDVQTLPQITGLRSNAPLCQGQALQLELDSVANALYLWHLPGGQSQITRRPFLWLPSSLLADSGLYKAAFILEGCTSSAQTSFIRIAPALPRPTVQEFQNKTSFCQGERFEFQVSNSEEFPADTRFIWEDGEGVFRGEGNLLLGSASNLGPNKMQVTAYSGYCRSSADIRFIVNSVPSPPMILNPSPVCEGSGFITLALEVAPENYRYFWEGPISSNMSTLRIPAASSFSGVYSLRVVSESGCTSAASQTNVRVLPTPGQPELLGDPEACQGERLYLEAKAMPGTLYEWKGPNGLVFYGNALSFSQAQPNQGGAYTLTALSGNCRSLPLEFQVSVLVPPPIQSIALPSFLCPGQSFTLKAEVPEGSVVIWNTPARGQLNGREQTLWNATEADAGLYTVFTVVGRCSSELKSQRIEIAQTPAISLTTNAPICQGQTLQITANASGSNAWDWRWQGPNGFEQNGGFAVSIENAEFRHSGFYTVTLGSGNCLWRASIEAIIKPRPKVSAVEKVRVCQGGRLTLDAQADIEGASFLWQGPFGIVGRGQTLTIDNIQPLQQGVYSVAATAQGCTSDWAITLVEVSQGYLQVERSEFSICPGQKIEAPLRLEAAHLPATLRYLRQGVVFEKPLHTPLDTLRFNAWQNESIVLQSLLTSEGCVIALQKNIEIRQKSLPAAAFDGDELFFCHASQAYLPLYLSGSGDWELVYKANGRLQPPLRIQRATSLNAVPILINQPLPLGSPSGVYELVSIKDNISGCAQAALGNFRINYSSNAAYVLEQDSVLEGCWGQSGLLLRAKLEPQVDSIFWITPQNRRVVGSSVALPPLTSADAGAYSFYAISRGCTVAAGITQVRVREKLPAPELPSRFVVCENQNWSIELPAIPNSSYYWQGPGGFSVIGNFIHFTALQANRAGIYTVERRSQGCSSAAATFEILVRRRPLASLDSSYLIICSGETIRVPISFQGTPPFSLVYRINGLTPVEVSGFNTSPYYLELPSYAPGLYALTLENVKDASACPEGITQGKTTLVVKDAPILVEAERINPICQAGSLKYAVSGEAGGYRYTLKGNQHFAQNETGIFENLAPGRYTLSVVNAFCATEIPINLTARQPTITHIIPDTLAGGLRIFWNEAPGALAYELRYRRAQSLDQWTSIDGIGGNSLLVYNLLPNTVYEFTLRAICAPGDTSDWSLERRALSPQVTQACLPPWDAFIKQVNLTSAVIEWKNSSHTVCTLLEYGLLSEDPANWFKTIIPAPGATFTLNHLEEGKQYGVLLRSNCSACSGRIGNFSSTASIYFIPRNNLRRADARPANFSIYPNPAQNFVTLRGFGENIATQGLLTLQLIDISGRIQLQTSFTGAENEATFERFIPLDSIPSGVYQAMVRDENSNMVWSAKLLVEK